jgi:hypothetical protein
MVVVVGTWGWGGCRLAEVWGDRAGGRGDGRRLMQRLLATPCSAVKSASRARWPLDRSDLAMHGSGGSAGDAGTHHCLQRLKQGRHVSAVPGQALALVVVPHGGVDDQGVWPGARPAQVAATRGTECVCGTASRGDTLLDSLPLAASQCSLPGPPPPAPHPPPRAPRGRARVSLLPTWQQHCSSYEETRWLHRRSHLCRSWRLRSSA